MSFEQLVHVSKIGQVGPESFGLVSDWGAKRGYVGVYIHDLPRLVEAHTLGVKVDHLRG
jgi:hypothetical protein